MASVEPRRRALVSVADEPLTAEPEVWAGVECSHLRIGERVVDQLELTGHDVRPSDMDAIASLGVSAVRYPVLWERVAPRGLPRADWSWTDDRLNRLRAHGVRPIAGLLHHGQGPERMSILHPDFVASFAGYARAVAQRYPWIDTYMPINEPLTTARFGGLYGWWQPHETSTDVCLQMLLVQCIAIRAAARQIKAVNPDARIIVNEDVGRTFSTPELADAAERLNVQRWLTWDVLMGRIDEAHPLYADFAHSSRNLALLAGLNADPFAPDILGVDHYVTSDRYLDHRVEWYIAERRAADEASFVNVEACRVRSVPGDSVARAINDTWRRYGRPLALTEISLAGEAHDQVQWWAEAWNAASEARWRGLDVRAVTAWSAFGAVDWHCLMRRDEGIYEPGPFDVSSGVAVERPVAAAIRAAADGSLANRVARANAGRSRGWWRLPNRYTLTIEPPLDSVAYRLRMQRARRAA